MKPFGSKLESVEPGKSGKVTFKVPVPSCEQCLIIVKESPHHAIIKLSEKTQTPIQVKELDKKD